MSEGRYMMKVDYLKFSKAFYLGLCEKLLFGQSCSKSGHKGPTSQNNSYMFFNICVIVSEFSHERINHKYLRN